MPKTKHPNRVMIDSDRFRQFLARKNLRLIDVGPIMDPPRCTSWASAVVRRGSIDYYTLDDLAQCFGMHMYELIHEFGTEEGQSLCP